MTVTVRPGRENLQSFSALWRFEQGQERAASPISCGSTLIAVVQAADLGEGNNIACGGKLRVTRPWAVLVEREMRSGAMMILKITRQYAAQVTLVEDDNVIQTFTADRTDETLDVRVLPR
jgi:hypothetical protein